MTAKRSVADFSSAYQMGASAPGTPGGTSLLVLKITADCTNLQLAYGNFHGDAAGPTAEVVPLHPIRVRASLQADGGMIVPLRFGGSLDADIAPGSLVMTDALPDSFSRGARLRIRTFVRAACDGGFPLATVTRSNRI